MQSRIDWDWIAKKHERVHGYIQNDERIRLKRVWLWQVKKSQTKIKWSERSKKIWSERRIFIKHHVLIMQQFHKKKKAFRLSRYFFSSSYVCWFSPLIP